MRIVDLIGRLEDGSLRSIACAEGEAINDVLKLRDKIIKANGMLVTGSRRGKEEIKLTELRVLANNVNGGELKTARKF